MASKRFAIASVCAAVVVGVFLFPKPPLNEAGHNAKQAGGNLPSGADAARAADPVPEAALPEAGKLPPKDAGNLAQAAIRS